MSKFDIEDAERKAKQSYLLAEIVDMNYDTDAFLEFCESKKSSNIDEWSFEELEKCTQEFKKIYKPKASRNLAQSQVKTASAQKVKNNSGIFADVEIETIDTQGCVKNELDSVINIKVIVCNPELVDPGFLSSNYIVYVVNTLPMNWIVRRKIEEFLWLRETLTSVFPGVFIPPMHKSSKTKTEDKTLYKRQVIYASFLNCALLNPLVRNSEYLIAFLKDEDLKNIMKNSKKSVKSREISNLVSYEGKAQLVYSEMTESYSALNEYLNKSEKSLSEILVKTKKLIADSVTLSDSIRDYAVDLSELSSCYVSINHKDSAQVFIDIKNVLFDWSDFTMKSCKNIYEDLKLPLLAFRQELAALRELVKEREAFLAGVKGKGKGCKDFLAYLNFSCLSQAGEVVSSSVERLRIKLDSGFKKKQEEIVNFHLVWGQLIANLAIIR